jgi:hypothetical protein
MNIVMKEDRIWILIARKLTSDASDKDIVELNKLLQDDPDLEEKMETITEIWELGENSAHE